MAVNIGSLTGGTILTAASVDASGNSAPVDPNLQLTVQNLAQQMAAAMPWIPFDVVGVMGLALQQNSYPYPIQRPTAPIPAWLADPNRQAQWQQIAGTWVPMTQAFLTGQIAQAVAYGQSIDTSTWGAVSSIAKAAGQFLVSTVEAPAEWVSTAAGWWGTTVEDAWADLQNALSQVKANRDAALAAIAATNAVLQNPLFSGRVPTVYAQTNANLQQQLSGAVSSVLSAIAPLGPQARAASGLGVAPLIIGAGITVAAIAAAAAVVWHYVSVTNQTKIDAVNNAHSTIQWELDTAEADYKAGRITYAQYEAIVGAANAAVNALPEGGLWDKLKWPVYIAAAGAGVALVVMLLRRMRRAA
jgi:hypothetical protein